MDDSYIEEKKMIPPRQARNCSAPGYDISALLHLSNVPRILGYGSVSWAVASY